MVTLVSRTQPLPQPIDAVIFDLDGTLVDSSVDLQAAVNRALAEHRLPACTHAQILAAIGDGARTLIERAMPVGRQSLVNEVHASFNRHYEACLLDATRPYAGITDLLQSLTMPLLVVSNKPERYCRQILAGLGLAERFCGIWGGDSLSVRKPDPDSLREPLQILGLAPTQALMVGDGAQDVRAAQGAGLNCCGVLWGFRTQQELEASGVRWLAASPADLLAALAPSSR